MEQVQSSLCISRRAEEEIERVSLRINGSLEIDPLFSYLDIGLIDPPGIGCGLHMRTATTVQLRSIMLDPAVNRRMIDRQSAFQHDFFQVAITERIAEIPPYT
jgi:hypothetical protein